jgi:Tfp pilus assembly protein PilF
VVQKALECFQRALELDPNFAAAYAGIADVYGTLARPSQTGTSFSDAEGCSLGFNVLAS